MKIGMLAPIAWRTPPKHYGPWERVSSLLTEELTKQGIDVTLFATGDSLTTARLNAVCEKGYEEDRDGDPKVMECLHIANCFEHAGQFDIIHNQFDFLPLSYGNLVKTPVVTTIHGFSSPKILPVYKAYNATSHYVSISLADQSPELDYIANVHHGIDTENFTFCRRPNDDYLLFFGRFHPDKGAKEAIDIAKKAGKKLILAGIIQDQPYFDAHVKPALQSDWVDYVGSVGPEKRDVLLGNAVALLHPIHFNEPFGLSVVESMACGTPVIAFNRGSMPELIDHQRTGFIVDSVDAAVECVGRIQHIDRLRCRLAVENKFSKERMAKNYISVYEKILRTL